MSAYLSISTLLLFGAFAGAAEKPVATVAETDKGSQVFLPFDAKMLNAQLAVLTEVKQADFYYPKIFPRPFVEGTATLSGGDAAQWFYYPCSGLCLRFKNGTERYFLKRGTVADTKDAEKEGGQSPK